MMKDDREEYCLARFDAILATRGHDTHHRTKPPQDPPDRYLDLGGHRLAVEITSTRHQTVAVDGGSIQSEQYEDLILRFTKDLERAARDAGYLCGSYLLSFFKPFASGHFPSHRKALLGMMLRGFAQLKDAPPGWRWEPNPGPYMDTVRLWKVDREGSTLTWSAFNSNGLGGALLDGERILRTAVQEKRRKLEKLAITEPAVLVILNTFDWLSGVDFRSIAKAVAEIHFYEAVFVIDRFTGFCTELTDCPLLLSPQQLDAANPAKVTP